MSGPESTESVQPEPSPDATVRLSVGEPPNPYATQSLNIPKLLGAESTLKLQLGAPEPPADQTQKLVLPRVDEPPIRRQKVDPPVETDGQTQKLPIASEPPPKPFNWKLPALVGVLIVIGVVGFLMLPRGTAPKEAPPKVAATPTPAKVAAPVESVPPEVQVYVDQAKAGDTHAMRMLGAMYLQGLNVPKDREKGLYWYRQAAEKGSDAARIELSQIEGGR